MGYEPSSAPFLHLVFAHASYMYVSDCNWLKAQRVPCRHYLLPLHPLDQKIQSFKYVQNKSKGKREKGILSANKIPWDIGKYYALGQFTCSALPFVLEMKFIWATISLAILSQKNWHMICIREWIITDPTIRKIILWKIDEALKIVTEMLL